MEKLIAEINKLGYAVQFYQWTDTLRWMTGDAQRWSAQANVSINGKGIGSMDEICFGPTANAALGELYIKCSAAAAKKRELRKPVVKDPFDFDEEEDPLA